MENQMEVKAELVATKQIISQVISLWAAQNKNVTTFFDKYAEAAYSKEVAAGRNRAIYLLGHLIAVNDGMIPLFGLGERMFPQFETSFLGPDKAIEKMPALADLKKAWVELNTSLTERFNNMSPSDWMGRHTAVSAEDFAKDPKRNKLNVLLTRTTHQSYHLGQLNLLFE